MCREIKREKRKETGKRFLISISCLILLSVDLLLLTYAAGLGIEKNAARKELLTENSFETEAAEEDVRYRAALREAGGFDNPIDDMYLSMLFYEDEADKGKTLRSYETAWQEQFCNYVEGYEARCGSIEAGEAVREYEKAVLEAVWAQRSLMEYMGVEEEKISWYSIQIYRCAFVKDIKGANEDINIMTLNKKEQAVREIPGRVYELYGEFRGETLLELVMARRERNEAEFQEKQENFDIDWCNQLCQLTMELYEGLDERGRELAGIWQESRENWKRASDECLWRLRTEVDAENGKISFTEEDAFGERMERDGWINRLYALQLQSMRNITSFNI